MGTEDEKKDEKGLTEETRLELYNQLLDWGEEGAARALVQEPEPTPAEAAQAAHQKEGQRLLDALNKSTTSWVGE